VNIDQTSEQQEFEALLRGYARPVADNGFTAATLNRIHSSSYKLRVPIITAAALIGGSIALSQVPMLVQFLNDLPLPNAPSVQPLFLTILIGFAFVAWAALDKGWSDTV